MNANQMRQHSSEKLLIVLCGLSPWAHVLAQTGVQPSATYPPVQVVDTALEYRQFEKVEITGSAILAKEAKQALPLQIIDRREIERSGATNLPAMLQSLPIMSNFTELGSVTGTFSGGPETAAIHANQSGTLVLLNGRRLPYYGSQSIMGERAVVDLNFVPLSAVERIEILTDGASSRYGSDAVAGVVNIITKSDLQGLHISAESSRPEGGKGSSQGMTLSWGKGRLQRDGFSLRTYLTTESKEKLLADQRESASQGARSIQKDGQIWWQRFNYSLSSAPAKNYVDSQGIVRNEYFEKNGECEPGWYELDKQQCYKNTQGDMTLYPATQKYMLYVQGEKILNNNWVLFAEGLTGKQSQVTVPSGSYWTLDVPNTDQTKYYMLDIVPLGLLNQKYSNWINNAVVGLKGEQNGWDFVTSLSIGRHRVERDWISGSVKRGFSSLKVDPVVIEQNPSEYSASILENFEKYRVIDKEVMDIGWTRIENFNFLASREWMSTDYGPISLGVGLDWRREAVRYENLANGGEENFGFNEKRTNWATHIEVSAPLGHNSELTTALRQDIYSDFGRVQTGKLGWKWKPSSTLMIRSSLGTGFRAPSLGQMAKVKTHIFDYYDGATNEFIPIITEGNSDLKPERAINKSFGMRFEPNQRLTLGADVWHVNIKDTFGNLTGSQIMGSESLSKKYFIDGEIHEPNLNLGRSVKSGVDYDIQWRQPTEWGRLRLLLKGTYLLKSKQQKPITGEYVSDLGIYADDLMSSTIRSKLSMSAMMERSEWTGGVVLNHRSGAKETTVLLNRDGETLNYSGRVPSFWTLDVVSRWQINPQLTLSTYLMNATNQVPAPLMAYSANVLMGVDTGRFGSYLGRTLKLKLDYKF